MIDPARLPTLRAGFSWTRPQLGGHAPLTDRAVAEYSRLGIWVAVVQEARSNAGYQATIGLHRPERFRASETWVDVNTAARWIGRWIELREDRILAEIRALTGVK